MNARNPTLYQSSFIQRLPVAIMVLDPDDIPLYVNPRFTELYGYRIQDLTTPEMWLEQAYPDPNYRAEVSEAWHRDLSAQSQEPPRQDYAVTCKDGRIRHTRFRVVVLADGTRMVTMDDVTKLIEAKDALQQAHQELETRVAERTAELRMRTEQATREIRWRDRVEQALRQSEARYRILVETSPDSIVALDSERCIVMCNDQALKLFGYTHRGEILGQPSSILYGPEVKEEMAHHRNQLENDGHITGIQIWMRRKDSSRFYAEFSVSEITDSDGKLLGFVGFTRDITERKRAEDAIRQRNFELSVLNNVTTAIVQSQKALESLLDRALSQTLNALELRSGWIGLSQPERNIRILKGVLEPDQPLYQAGRALRERAFGRVRQNQETVLESDIPLRIKKDDTPIICSVGYVPLTRDDRVIGVLGVLAMHQSAPHRLTIQDSHLLRAIGNQISLAVKHTQLSKEASQAAQLRELDRLRSELIANFSHNLRSPLGIIEMASTTLLREDLNLNLPTRRALIEDIEAETSHLAHIVDGILDLGHLQSEEPKLTMKRIHLMSVIDKAVERMSGTSSSHSILVDRTAGQLDMVGDAKRLEEVIVNLLDNAVKYSPQGREIIVKVLDAEDHEATIEVTDRGIGIPEDELERIFERFYRVKNEVTQQITGNGLGLAICRAVIEAHNGRIWAESALGKGTTVVLKLPLAAG